MVKIAYCIYGMSYGKHNAKDNIYSACKNLQNWTDQLFSKYNNIDIFIHTWNEESRQDINQYLKPKKLLIEDINKINNQVIMVDKYPSNKILLNNTTKKISKTKLNNKQTRDFNTLPLMYGKYSRFYSMYQADQLRQQYESEHKFTYDIVINTRFDVFYNININLLDLDYNKIYCVPKKNMAPLYFTVAHPNDYLYFSNSSNMTKMCQIWLNLYDIYTQLLGNKKYTQFVNSHLLIGQHIKISNLIPQFSFLSPEQFYIDHNSTDH